MRQTLRYVIGWYKTNWKIAVVCLIIVGPVSYAYFDREVPIEILEMRVENPNVRRNENLVITYKIKRSRICTGVITRLVLDSQDVIQEIVPYQFGNIYNITGLVQPVGKPAGSPRKVGEIEELRLGTPVPGASAPGPAKYQGVIVYYCSWLQERLNFGIQAVTPVTDFNILPEPNPMVLKPQRLPGSIDPTPVERLQNPLLFKGNR